MQPGTVGTTEKRAGTVGQALPRLARSHLNYGPAVINSAMDVMPFVANGNPFGLDLLPFMVNGDPFARDGMPFVRDGMPFTLDLLPSTLKGNPFVPDGMPFALDGMPFALDLWPFTLNGMPSALEFMPFVLGGFPFSADGMVYAGPIAVCRERVARARQTGTRSERKRHEEVNDWSRVCAWGGRDLMTDRFARSRMAGSARCIGGPASGKGSR